MRPAISDLASFHGRLARGPYWRGFAPKLALPIVTTSTLVLTQQPLFIALVFSFASAVPLLSSGYRRLQDTGVHGADAVLPWWQFAISALLATCAFQGMETVKDAFASTNPPDGPTGFWFAAIYGLGSALLLIIAFIFFVVFLMRITPAAAQTLLPSQPGPNKYGPNPNEVSS